MRTITQLISVCAALPIPMRSMAWQLKEVQEAIVEANNNDFATGEQVNAVFAKYGVLVEDSGEAGSDQILFNLNSDQFRQLTEILNEPAAVNQGLSRLMGVQAPWEVFTPAPL